MVEARPTTTNYFLKENQNAPRPSEPSQGEKNVIDRLNLIGFSHTSKLVSKIQPEKHHLEGKNARRPLDNTEKTAIIAIMVQKYSEKATSTIILMENGVCY